MIRKDVLEKAIALTTGSRQSQHGDPEPVFDLAAALWGAYMGVPITAEDVCHMMALMKIARTQHGSLNADDYVDACGYEALAGEIAGANV